MSNREDQIELMECVTDYLIESEQPDSKRYKCAQLAFRAMDELGIDFFYAVQTDRLPVLGARQVVLPETCLMWTKVGVFNGVGELSVLAVNPRLSTYRPFSTDRPTRTTDKLTSYWNPSSPVFFNYTGGGLAYDHIYGVSNLSAVGSFRVVEQDHVLLLNPDYPYDYLAVEMQLAPDPTRTYYIPRVFREAVVAYLTWKDTRSLPMSRRNSPGLTGQNRHNFYNERRLAQARYRPFRLEQAYQVSLEAQRLSVKS